MSLFKKGEDNHPELEQEREEKKRPNIFGKAKSAVINAIDQNADGSFDMNDITLLAENMGANAKKAASAAGYALLLQALIHSPHLMHSAESGVIAGFTPILHTLSHELQPTHAWLSNSILSMLTREKSE